MILLTKEAIRIISTLANSIRPRTLPSLPKDAIVSAETLLTFPCEAIFPKLLIVYSTYKLLARCQYYK